MTDITPLDPDLVLITGFLSNSLSEREMDVVQARLADDEAFFEKVAPIMRIWTMPMHFGTVAAKMTAGNLAPVGLPKTFGEAKRRREVEAFGTGLPAADGTFATFRKRFDYVVKLYLWMALGVDKRVGVPEAQIDKHPFWSRAFTWAEHFQHALLVAIVGLVIPWTLYVTYDPYDQHALSTKLVRTLTRSSHAPGVRIQTPAGQEFATTVPGGAQVLLRSGSVLEWSSTSPLVLTGAAVIEVPASVRELRVVMGRNSDVVLAPGRYAIATHDYFKGLFLITVGSGLARIRADTTKDDPQFLKAGERGSIADELGTNKENRGRAGPYDYPIVPKVLPWEPRVVR